MKRLLKLTLLGTALTASTTFAATIVTYTDAGAFNASGIVGGSATVTETFAGNTSLFTTFSVAPSPYGFSGDARSTRVLAGSNPYSEVITLDAGNMTAFGGTWNLGPGGIGSGIKITISLVGGGTQVLTPILGYAAGTTGNNPFFFGFTSDVAFTAVTLSIGGQAGSLSEVFTLDNLLVEQDGAAPPPPPPSGVPEPSTFGLMGAAMVGLGLLRRARR
jgi:hypothetical protein